MLMITPNQTATPNGASAVLALASGTREPMASIRATDVFAG